MTNFRNEDNITQIVYHNKDATRMVECLECGTNFDLPDNIKIGEVIDCPNCGAQLEVFSIDPPVIDIFEEEEK